VTPAVKCNSPGGAVRFGPADLFIIMIGSLLVLVVGAHLVGVRINLTGSLPPGLYLAARAAPARGSLVLACLPPVVGAFAKVRGYVPSGGPCPGGLVPVGKQVWAVAGDTVTVSAAGLSVNWVALPNSAPLFVDRLGRRLPKLAGGQYVVNAGELWVGSTYSRSSFDSRYFGALEATQLRTSIRPFWTAPSAATSRPSP
jgi:conjugative transfer signal peptidase TraF